MTRPSRHASEITLRTLAPAQVFRWGALYGFAAWTAFAAVEYLLWSVWPHFVRVHCGAAPLVWDDTLGRLALYPLVGAAAGGAGALMARAVLPVRLTGERDAVLARVASLTLLAGVGVGVLLQFEPRGVGAALLVLTATLGVILAAGLVSPGWASATRRVAGLWMVVAVLLGVARLGAQGEFGEPKVFVYRSLAVYLGLVATVVLLSWLRGRRRAASARTPAGRKHPSIVHIVRLPVAAVAGALAVGFALDSGAYLAASRPAPEVEQADVILIVMDTARADHLSVYGYDRDTTPNLKKFAERATTYTRAMAASNHTLPSHASLFTGLYPASHGAHPLALVDRKRPAAEGLALAPRLQTLAERLAVRGYLTAGVAANYAFVSSGYNLDQGFDRFATRFSRCAAPSPALFLEWIGRAGFAASTTDYHRASEINRDVIGLIDRLSAHQNPFFQFVNYMDAHWPYAPPPPYDQRFPGKDASFDDGAFLQLRDEVLQRKRRITDRERRHLVSQYDGGIAFLDDQLGRLFSHLEARGRYDSSLIIITSDHGEAFGERDLLEHGTSLYEDQVHVPLLIKFPRQQHHAIVRSPVGHADILPTVLDVAGLPSVDDVQGVSLLRLKARASRAVISESYPRPYFQNLSDRFHRVDRAYVEDRYKLMTSTAAPPELYNLQEDPGEQRNVFRSEPNVAQKMLGTFNRWMATTVVESGDAPAMDSETLERLRSLGYVK